MSRPWNKVIETRNFWDPSADNGRGIVLQKASSLKDRLANRNGMEVEQFLNDLATGLVQVMEAIDQIDDPFRHEHEIFEKTQWKYGSEGNLWLRDPNTGQFAMATMELAARHEAWQRTRTT